MSTADPKQLKALAAFLDCSSDAFTDSKRLPEDLGALVELFDLWSRIDAEESRLRLVSFVRHLTERDSGAGNGTANRPGSSH